MFSYEHLAAFCATVEEGSYSKAARKLGKDRTTVREQIKALEDSYAIVLFDIQGKSAVVTEAGQAIYKQSQLLVRNSERLNTRLLKSYLEPITQLDIYHDVLVPAPLILHIEAFMDKHYPDVKLNWLHRNRDDALKAVSEGSHQLALMQYKLTSQSPYSLGYVNLGSDDLNVYCNPNHPLTGLAKVTIGDLQLEKQYLSENLIVSAPELFSVSTNVRVVSNNDILLELVKNDGWTVIPQSLAEPLVKQKQLIKLPLDELASSLNVGISFFYPDAMENTPELQTLLSSIKAFAAKYYQ
ncbi:LysR family transcriptional regulator [Grimontia sp. S25]|uniref:LysR family transcriptional regulator n=1 Tax=Grimontia sedimenti TaxID=2711294 RepID=A0A6M1RI63_9GAMM|nr:LysR family transcriptional regulator [Grimontia sedimenti]NGN97951.1 LysR family transcriptional regulator [Grimontia sedimenti]